MSIHDLVQVVDEQDQPVHGATRQEIWKKGLLHRVVYIMVESPDGEILLQKRGPAMETYPNCWDVSAAGHVDNGEDYLTAAKRELAEELGIKDIELDKVGDYRSSDTFRGLKMNRFNEVYKVVVPKDIQLSLQASELADARWFSRKELTDLVTNHPEHIANGLRRVVDKFYT